MELFGDNELLKKLDAENLIGLRCAMHLRVRLRPSRAR